MFAPISRKMTFSLEGRSVGQVVKSVIRVARLLEIKMSIVEIVQMKCESNPSITSNIYHIIKKTVRIYRSTKYRFWYIDSWKINLNLWVLWLTA